MRGSSDIALIVLNQEVWFREATLLVNASIQHQDVCMPRIAIFEAE
jgi:hypothetical protein